MTFFEIVVQQWTQQSVWEIVGVVLAIAYVWLAARQSVWCWPSALIGTGIYTWLLWEHSLPMQSFLHFYYLLMAVYGWWHWQANREQEPLQVIEKSWHYHLGVISGLLLLSLLLIQLLASSFSAEHLYLDVLTTVFSLFTTWMVTQKILENWLYWMVINSVSAYLYWQTGLYLTTLLFVSYFGFAVYGYVQWRKTLLTSDEVFA